MLKFRIDIDAHAGVGKDALQIGEWDTAFFAVDSGQLLRFNASETGDVSTAPDRFVQCDLNRYLCHSNTLSCPQQDLVSVREGTEP
jgi:hypothetical protein